MKTILRTPSINDAKALANLGRETFIETFAHLYDAADLHSFLNEAYAVENIKQALCDPENFYQWAEIDAEPIGFCKISNRQTLAFDSGDGKAVQLNQLYIRGAYHGRGVAHALMQWALDVAKMQDATDMVLSVYCDNARAQSFYNGYDFIHIGDTIFPVGTQDDHEYILHKQL